jgi:predicted metal-dependent hydrolase
MFTVDDQAAGPHDASLDHERLVLEARDVQFDWAKLPLHYVPNDPFATHVLKVLHLLLPAGEEFFVEVFKKTLPLIKDDQLRLDVQGFIGQESVHSQAHSAVLDHFAAQGVDVTPYTDQIKWLFERLLGDRPRRSLRRQHSWLLEQVSFVSAIEHYTAILGEWILNAPAHDAIGTDRTMLDMLRWHGAEEVEHKAVAFDTMKHLRAGYWRQVRAQLVVTRRCCGCGFAECGSCTRWIRSCRRGSSRAGAITSTRHAGAWYRGPCDSFGWSVTTTGRGFTRRSWAGWGSRSTTWPSHLPPVRLTDR